LDFVDSNANNIEKAVNFLLENNQINKEDKLVAISDFRKNDKELPLMEIVYVKDLI
jgi:hypothetical protein